MRYPNLEICQLHTTKLPNDLFNIDRLEDYIPNNPGVAEQHSHNFYHLAYIRNGSGSHSLDFESYVAGNHTIYFMYPGQVHSWHMHTGTTGYVINFSPEFLDTNFIRSELLGHLPLFHKFGSRQVHTVPEVSTEALESQLETMYVLQQTSGTYRNLELAGRLGQLLVGLSATLDVGEQLQVNAVYYRHYLNFLALLEQHFTAMKLPKEYAAVMHITPHHLNQVVQHFVNISAGELIRNRILLEAKRLLVKEAGTVSEIAYMLNFTDSSYFVKFFKKYTGTTPEVFRASAGRHI